MDSAAAAALARHDAGLISLAAGHYAEAARMLAEALAEGAEVSRPAARLARAEALARSGHPDDAAAELRRAALEPVRDTDLPWALVPRMARVQGLIALAPSSWPPSWTWPALRSSAWSNRNGSCAGSPPNWPSWTS
jgi:hypothetical protein